MNTKQTKNPLMENKNTRAAQQKMNIIIHTMTGYNVMWKILFPSYQLV